MHVVNGAVGPDQSAPVPLQEVSSAVSSSVSRAADPTETVDGDRELFERALKRLRTGGETVQAQDVLGPVEDD